MAKAPLSLSSIPTGRRLGKLPKNEADHFIRCPVCAEWIDMRDLGQVIEHEAKACRSDSVTSPNSVN
jgi:CRISPR/Cas system type I-B associated protein Csh2 (Cas7 group RAMP superfamily)